VDVYLTSYGLSVEISIVMCFLCFNEHQTMFFISSPVSGGLVAPCLYSLLLCGWIV
jgi:hypothetical protein